MAYIGVMLWMKLETHLRQKNGKDTSKKLMLISQKELILKNTSRYVVVSTAICKYR